jgi:hypothetical protein
VLDTATLERWIHKVGYDTAPEGEATLRILPRNGAHPDLPPFFAQLGANWVLLSMLPVLPEGAALPPDLSRRLLSVNRDMRIAKFALDGDGEVVLCAELPTESLDDSELVDAVERMVKYFKHYREYLLKP